MSDDGLPAPRHVVLFAWEPGEAPNEKQDLGGAFEGLGEITARMHLHVRGWTRPAGFERFAWDYETTLGSRPHWGSWRDGVGLTPEIEALFARAADLVRRRLEGFGETPSVPTTVGGVILLGSIAGQAAVGMWRQPGRARSTRGDSSCQPKRER